MFNHYQEIVSNDLVREEVITPLPEHLGKGILKVFLCLSHPLDFAFLSHYLTRTLCPAVGEEFHLTGTIYCHTGLFIVTLAATLRLPPVANPPMATLITELRAMD